ncbi:hypothetical protein L596_027310 [Steinernema carpocapsae]|nr:hypothetical protein L596_027310 [Steinernema carpocapsae]
MNTGILRSVAFFAMSATVAFAYTEILTKEDQYQYERYLWCPTKFVGSMCPENDLFSFHLCCGDLNQKCCSHTRAWVMVLLGFVGIGVFLGLIGLGIRLLRLRAAAARDGKPINYTQGQQQFDTPKHGHQANV